MTRRVSGLTHRGTTRDTGTMTGASTARRGALASLISIVALALSGCVFPDDFQVETDTAPSALCPVETPEACPGDRCVNFLTDPSNCGTCDRSCGEGGVCVDGTCVCAAGTTACGDECVDPTSDARHCGACDAACADALACIDGACTCTGEGLATCDGTCTDTDTDVANCGGCDLACPEGARCEAGRCWDDFLPDSQSVACVDDVGNVIPGCDGADAAGQDGAVNGRSMGVAGASNDGQFEVLGLELRFLRKVGTNVTLLKAQEYCDGISGTDVWRVPTYFELLAAVDAHAGNGPLWTKPEYFDDVDDDLYAPLWTITPRPGDDDDVLVIDLSAPANRIGFRPTTESGSVACVTSPRPPLELEFVDESPNVVRELRTGIAFLKPVQTGQTWAEARAYCLEVDNGACAPWHLGSIKELGLLLANPDASPATEWFRQQINWTSTPVYDETTVYAFYGPSGFVGPLDRAQSAAALCVCDPNVLE